MTTLESIQGSVGLAADLQAWAAGRRDRLLNDLADLLALDAPTGDAEALATTEELLHKRLLALGAEVSLCPSQAGVHIEARWNSGANADPIAILGHYDTVWPRGTAAARGLRIEAGVAAGPGVFDMRGGLVAALASLHALLELGALTRPVTMLLTADEESGSRTSKAMVTELAGAGQVVLIPEPPLPGGALKTARKGLLTFRVTAQGRAAHAGLEPERGVNAIHELVGALGSVLSLARSNLGTTVNVGTVEGGLLPNVIAPFASAEIDVRVANNEEYERIGAAFWRLARGGSEARIGVERLHTRRAMERTPPIAQAFERARAVAALVGIDLREGAAGGASDGNFLAPLGVGVLDGLGPEGGGAHSLDEHIEVRSLEERTTLLALLIALL